MTMNGVRWHFKFMWVVLASGLIAGCAADDGDGLALDVVPVKGLVLLNGKPAAGVAVTFVPDGETVGQECTGGTDDAGNFTLKPIRGKGEGAPPGDYKVVLNRWVKPDGTVVPFNSPEPPANLLAVESLPPKYSVAASSELKAKVPDEGGEFKFEITLP